MDNMSLGTAAIYSLLGIAVVFGALALLMVLIKILYALTDRQGKDSGADEPAASKGSAVLASANPAEKTAPLALAAGTAGDIKLYDTDPRDAAMVMAILADQLGKPLNELRFISIREVGGQASDEI